MADFDGATYDPDYDRERLTTQLGRVYAVMIDEQWRTLREIAAVTGDPEASISARLRDFRKEKFGGYRVEARRLGDAKRGLWEYQFLRWVEIEMEDLPGESPSPGV